MQGRGDKLFAQRCMACSGLTSGPLCPIPELYRTLGCILVTTLSHYTVIEFLSQCALLVNEPVSFSELGALGSRDCLTHAFTPNNTQQDTCRIVGPP